MDPVLAFQKALQCDAVKVIRGQQVGAFCAGKVPLLSFWEIQTVARAYAKNRQ